MEYLFIGFFGFFLHEVFHLFLALGGFVAMKKIFKKIKHKDGECCLHEKEN